MEGCYPLQEAGQAGPQIHGSFLSVGSYGQGGLPVGATGGFESDP